MALLCRNCFSCSQLLVLPARLLLKPRNTLEANLPHARFLPLQGVSSNNRTQNTRTCHVVFQVC